MKTLVKINLEIALVCSEEQAEALLADPAGLIKSCFENNERYLLDYKTDVELLANGIDVQALLEQREKHVLACDDCESERAPKTKDSGRFKLL